MRLTLFFLGIITLSLTFSARAQSEGCIKFKYFDFFVPGDASEIRWPAATINRLIGRHANGDGADWLVPLIISQLAHYRPGCGSDEVDARFELLLRLYSVVRRNSVLVPPAVPLPKNLVLIRSDFYSLLQDDRSFHHLILSWDDGPLLGEPTPTRGIRPIALKEVPTVFGKLRFANTSSTATVTAFDRTGKSLWSRILRGTYPQRRLKALSLETLQLEQTDFIVMATVYVDGEKLTLYVRPNGRFLYYNHSW